ncbi:MAG: hypothetical protein IH586_04475 [Anaerolineaceae bacterium]|nr:hypothetical protein [Anaerolineaceae bacterium]
MAAAANNGIDGYSYRFIDLLSLARLESGTADLQHTPVNLNSLLRRV